MPLPHELTPVIVIIATMMLKPTLIAFFRILERPSLCGLQGVSAPHSLAFIPHPDCPSPLAHSWWCLDIMAGLTLQQPSCLLPASPYALGSDALSFAAVAFSALPAGLRLTVPLAMARTAPTTRSACPLVHAYQQCLRILLPSHPCRRPESCALAAMVIAPAITTTATAVDPARMMAAAAAMKCPAPPTAMSPQPQPQHNCLYYILLGPVQVQTLEEPEPDPKSSSLRFRFRFTKICELDPKSSSRFEEIYPQTGLNQTAASLVPAGQLSGEASEGSGSGMATLVPSPFYADSCPPRS